MERREAQLWEDCKKIFGQTKNDKTDELSCATIHLVKEYKDVLSIVADNDFLFNRKFLHLAESVVEDARQGRA